MKKRRVETILFLLSTFFVLARPVDAQITITYTFTSGTVANPDEVNANFTALASNALNRAGGTLTGNLTANAGVTVDGIDVGAVLGGSGTVTFSALTATTFTCTGCVGATQLAATAVSASSYGTTTAVPTFTVDADGRLTAAGTTTLSGAIIASGAVAVARGGTNADLSATGGANQFVRQNSTGAAFTVGAIVDADVPDTITITWASVNKAGSSLADLVTRSAADLSSGTLADARLSANIPKLDTAPTFTNAVTATHFRGGTTAITLVSGNNNNIDPSTAQVLLLDTTAGAATLTGFSGGSSARPLTICNVGANPMATAASDANSAASNQILAVSATINAGVCTGLIYDSTANRWRVVQ